MAKAHLSEGGQRSIIIMEPDGIKCAVHNLLHVYNQMV